MNVVEGRNVVRNRVLFQSTANLPVILKEVLFSVSNLYTSEVWVKSKSLRRTPRSPISTKPMWFSKSRLFQVWENTAEHSYVILDIVAELKAEYKP